MSEPDTPNQVSQENAANLTLTDEQYLDATETLVGLMKSVAVDVQEFNTLAKVHPVKVVPLFKPSIPGGWFYEHTFNEHIDLFLHFSDLSGHFKELIDSGMFFENDFLSMEIDPPEWMNSDDDEDRKACMFTALYTLQKSIRAIEAVARPINQLIEEGRKGDRSALKLAIKLDVLAMTSPTVAAEIMKSDVIDKGRFRNEIKNSLRYPHRVKRVNHGMLRFVLKTMYADGRLEKLTEKNRYEFFCKRLQIYPDENFEAPYSLNRFIRHCVKSFRT